jgi:hypothetical protein
MDGPINFGERDKFWGLLTEGFIEPLFGMNYNFPYYKDLFENYGFKFILSSFVLPDRFCRSFTGFHHCS